MVQDNGPPKIPMPSSLEPVTMLLYPAKETSRCDYIEDTEMGLYPGLSK